MEKGRWGGRKGRVRRMEIGREGGESEAQGGYHTHTTQRAQGGGWGEGGWGGRE